MKEGCFKYDVTLSFAEEDRAFVDQVAARLKNKGIRIFYDNYEQIETWGKDLSVYLDEVYREKAKFCVIFISAHYKNKRWTRYETERALLRAYFTKNKEYILPFRFDDTEIDGLSDTTIYLSTGKYQQKELAKAIINKLKKDWLVGDHIQQWGRYFFFNKIRLSAIILAMIIATVLHFSDNLTPVDALASRLHERNKSTFCIICGDGWSSFSHDQGTCSGHQGIEHYVTDTIIYRKTMEQCRKEALKTSWFAP